MQDSSFWDYISFGKIGAGFLIGFSVGFFFKKSIKIVIFLFGFMVVLAFALQYYNVINLSSDTLLSSANSLIVAVKSLGAFLKDNLSSLELSGGAGAVAGFILGLKVG